MKRSAMLLICLGFLLQARAQQIQKGGYGYFMTGPCFTFNSRVDNYLSRPDVIGPSYNAPNTAVIAGGEGFAVINRFLIGGGGYGLNHFRQSGDSASVLESSGGGYFKSGYIFWLKKNSFMTANIGFGGFGNTYEIRNERAKNGVYFNQEFPVRVGESRRYGYGGTSFDFSYGLKTVVGKNENGRMKGFMVGVDAGCMLKIATGSWYGSEDVITGPPSPGTAAVPYIRFTIGGGGFTLK